jgi:hypothetical protein
MFQLFLRARAHKYLRTWWDDQAFKARSTERDAKTDATRVGSILKEIDHALHEAEHEQSGLNRRVEDVLARAAVTLWNVRRSTAIIKTCSTPKSPMDSVASRSSRLRSRISSF